MGCLDPGTAVMLWLPLPAIEEVELGGDEDEDEEGAMGVGRWRFPKADWILDPDVSTVGDSADTGRMCKAEPILKDRRRG